MISDTKIYGKQNIEQCIKQMFSLSTVEIMMGH